MALGLQYTNTGLRNDDDEVADIPQTPWPTTSFLKSFINE